MDQGNNSLTDRAFAEMSRAVRRVNGSSKSSGPYGAPAVPANGTWYYAKLTSNLAPGSLSSPNTFTFDVWFPDSDSGSDPKPFIVATESNLLGLTGVNRSNMRGSAGTMIKVEFAYGEWSPKWVDCP